MARSTVPDSGRPEPTHFLSSWRQCHQGQPPLFNNEDRSISSGVGADALIVHARTIREAVQFPAPFRKYKIRLDIYVNQKYRYRPSRARRGTYRDRHGTLGAGGDGRGDLRCNGLISKEIKIRTPDEGKPRTAKSCGPGAATLALRWREFLADNGGKKGRFPEESTYKP